MLINFLIGHRGSGKSTLLKKIKKYKPNCLCFDLDTEIQKYSKQTIEEIFSQYGENYFRELELEVVSKLLTQINTSADVYVSLGAGFKLEFLDRLNCLKQVLWIKRTTDSGGRIFLDRPRLSPDVSPLKEYNDRFHQREKLYHQYSDEILILPEGADDESMSEACYFNNIIDVRGASITLLPKNFKNFDSWYNKRKNWNFKYFEIRTDLLNEAQINQAINLIPHKHLLLSIRTKNYIIPKGHFKIDWPLEWGLPTLNADILSVHEFNTNLDEQLKLLSRRNEHIKLACHVHNLKDLFKIHQWYLEKPKQRSFLPRGYLGQWYRLYLKEKSELNFIKEESGSAPEQPTLLQWLNTQSFTNNFYAVIGSPVQHSYSPYFHRNFASFYAIELSENDSFDESLNILKNMGLRGAAITSPYKRNAYLNSHKKTEQCDLLLSANTLFLNNDLVYCENTDFIALKKCLSIFLNVNNIVIWGGGGVLSSVMNILPHAQSYSSSQGKLRNKGEKERQPDVVIWAAPTVESTVMPPAHWKPEIIYDLNYTASSLGREYALKTNAKYVSGFEMFKIQAQEQQLFWSKFERK